MFSVYNKNHQVAIQEILRERKMGEKEREILRQRQKDRYTHTHIHTHREADRLVDIQTEETHMDGESILSKCTYFTYQQVRRVSRSVVTEDCVVMALVSALLALLASFVSLVSELHILCVWECVCMYVCVCVCVRTCICICELCVCACTHMYMHIMWVVCLCVYMCVYECVCICVCMCVCMCLCVWLTLNCLFLSSWLYWSECGNCTGWPGIQHQ